MKIAVLLANVVGWPILQMSIAHISVRWPDSYVALHLIPSSRQLQEANFYRTVLRIKKWKHLLPDGGAWIGSKLSKHRLESHTPDYLLRFAAEARRGELAHGCMFLRIPMFYIWNPFWACAVITVYAFAANAPCIIVQRYNRFMILRCLAKFQPKNGKMDSIMHLWTGGS